MLVLHDQYCLALSLWDFRRRFRPGIDGLPHMAWQVDSKRRSNTLFAVDIYKSVVLLNDAIDRR